jgi:hypothetical protein
MTVRRFLFAAIVEVLVTATVSTSGVDRCWHGAYFASEHSRIGRPPGRRYCVRDHPAAGYLALARREMAL